MFLTALSLGSLQPALQPDDSLQSSNRPSSSADRKAPVAVPSGRWAMHPGDLNCYDGHGAPGASGAPHAKSVSMQDCKAACLDTSGCRAIVVEFDSPPAMRAWSTDLTCYLREEVRPEECVHGAPNYEMYTFDLAPLSPPSPPPPFSVGGTAGRINQRFRMGWPSNNLTEVCRASLVACVDPVA